MSHTRIVVTRYGGSDALEVIEEGIPDPGPGEVKITPRHAPSGAHSLCRTRRARFPDRTKPRSRDAHQATASPVPGSRRIA